MKPRLLLLIPLLLLTTVATAVESENLKSGVFEPPRQAPGFTLTASNGTEFSLSQAQGKLVILGFGFTHCPNICPMTLANLAQARKKLGALADDVQVVYVTVDPERDNPIRLREYLNNFDSSFIGVTGTEEQLAALRKEYGIIAAKEIGKNGEYEVHHSSYIYLIDRTGLLRALVPFGKSADDIVHDVKILLQTKVE